MDDLQNQSRPNTAYSQIFTRTEFFYIRHIDLDGMSTNADCSSGAIMKYCIFFYIQVGFKPAGGIRTAKEAITWLMLVKEELGVEWLKPELFRLGASSLLEDIEKQVSC